MTEIYLIKFLTTTSQHKAGDEEWVDAQGNQIPGSSIAWDQAPPIPPGYSPDGSPDSLPTTVTNGLGPQSEIDAGPHSNYPVYVLVSSASSNPPANPPASPPPSSSNPPPPVTPISSPSSPLMFTLVEMIGRRGVGNFDLLDLVFAVSMEGGQVIDEINNSRSQEIERLNNWLHDNESYENQLIATEDDVSGDIAKDIGNCSNAPSIEGPKPGDSNYVPIRTYDTSNLFGPDANGNPGTPIYSTNETTSPETLAVIQQAITQNNNVRTTVSDQIQQISQYITSDINYKNQLYSTLSNLYSAFFQSDSAINKNFVNS